MKVIFLFLGLFFFQGCSLTLSTPRKVIRKVHLSDKTVVYEFSEDKSIVHLLNGALDLRSYCLQNVELVINSKKRFSFFDNYEDNFFVEQTLKSEKWKRYLNENLNEALLLEMEPMWNSSKRKEWVYPNRRIGDNPFKFVLGNLAGYQTITSNSIFKDKYSDDKLYLAFKVSGDFFYYRAFSEPSIKRAHSISANIGCRTSSHLLNDDFIIIDELSKYAPLTEVDLKQLGLTRVSMDTIRIFIPE